MTSTTEMQRDTLIKVFGFKERELRGLSPQSIQGLLRKAQYDRERAEEAGRAWRAENGLA